MPEKSLITKTEIWFTSLQSFRFFRHFFSDVLVENYLVVSYHDLGMGWLNVKGWQGYWVVNL